MSYFLSAYNAAPTTLSWDSADEHALLRGLADDHRVSGLELPFDTALHRTDEKWLLQQIPPNWEIIITLIPGTVSRLKTDAQFGLASTSERARASAMRFCAESWRAVHRANAALGRRAVKAIQIHSAPSVLQPVSAANEAALVQSLSELASWDWQGARLVLEHCDAHTGQFPTVKGFLPQDVEINAVHKTNQECGTGIGVSVNWARSTIEGRSSSTVSTHVERAQEAGLLAGVVFSGCSPEETMYGPPWADAHLPPAHVETSSETFIKAARGSILTQEEIRRTLTLCAEQELDFLGVKVAVPGKAPLSGRDRLLILKDSMDAIDAAKRRPEV